MTTWAVSSNKEYPLIRFPDGERGNLKNVTKNEFMNANDSIDRDVWSHMPLVGLGFAARQVIYGIFEMLAGIATISSKRCFEGMRNIVRGGVEIVPIAGFWIMTIYDYSTGYRATLLAYIDLYDACKFK